MGTSYYFKISETTVYICPLKTNDVKIETIFSFKKDHKTYFSMKKRSYSMIIILT